jgi:hypothetical protein
MNSKTLIKEPYILENIMALSTNFKEDTEFSKIRVLRDISTKCYVNNILNNDNTLFNLVQILFIYINSNILNATKQHLIDDEKILFFFKGGNVMYFWRKKIEAQFNFERDENIYKNTSSSDNDFTIYILTRDEIRYNILYDLVKNILIHCLKHIAKVFDNLYIQYGNRELIKNRNNNRDSNYYSNNNGRNNNRRKNINGININYDLEKYKNSQMEDYEFEDIVMNNFQNFYTKQNINDMIIDISSEINNLENKKFVNELNYGYENKYYKLHEENIVPKDIYINKREDLYVLNKNKLKFPNEIIETVPTKYHYLSVNDTICNSLIKAAFCNNFDLYRLKFNIILSKIIKLENTGKEKDTQIYIPSEFIDVSIPKFTDSGLTDFRNIYFKNNNNYTNYLVYVDINNKNNFNLLTMNYKYIIKDLCINLFNQNYYTPFLDQKYKKRLFRICFFIFPYINSIRDDDVKKILHNTFNATLFDNINDDFYNKFLLGDYDVNMIKNMIGNISAHFFDIKPEFIFIKSLINYTILFNKIINNYDVLEKAVNYYNDIYKIENLSVSDYKTAFNKYIEDLRDAYKLAYNYYHNNETQLGGGINNNNNIYKKLLYLDDGVKLKFKRVEPELTKGKKTYKKHLITMNCLDNEEFEVRQPFNNRRTHKQNNIYTTYSKKSNIYNNRNMGKNQMNKMGKNQMNKMRKMKNKYTKKLTNTNYIRRNIVPIAA